MIAQGEAREQWRLLDAESQERLKTLGVREGQRFLSVANALAPQAMERRCMLTALFHQVPPPQGIPREPVLEVAALGGRNARAFGYEVIGPVALRIDIVERLGESLRHPQGARQAQTLMQQLRLEGAARAQVLRSLGGPAAGAVSKKRRRRRGKPPATAASHGLQPHPGLRRSGAGKGALRGRAERPGGGTRTIPRPPLLGSPTLTAVIRKAGVRLMVGGRVLSPVLLVGAGTGEATCGILYLASYLRRGGVEAFVRLYDGDETEAEVMRSFESLVSRVRPKLVGISLKWFHHVDRALLIARTLRKIDPAIRIVVGGNSASYWWRELNAYDCIDHIVLGDGELPLLAICNGDPSPPNCVTRDPDGRPRRLPLAYVQRATNTEDIYYSHFNELFLSQMDLNSFSGWVAPGKGCGENCLYCGGARGNQKAAFGRAKPFLRSEESVRRDHQEIAGRTWQMRYDFAGSTAEFLGSTWAGVDLSRHCCTYFLWGVPRVELVEALSRTFQRIYMVIDIGCFSEQQRLEQMGRGLLKPCAKDRSCWTSSTPAAVMPTWRSKSPASEASRSRARRRWRRSCGSWSGSSGWTAWWATSGSKRSLERSSPSTPRGSTW